MHKNYDALELIEETMAVNNFVANIKLKNSLIRNIIA